MTLSPTFSARRPDRDDWYQPSARGSVDDLDWVLDHVCVWNVVLNHRFKYHLETSRAVVDPAVYALEDLKLVVLHPNGLVGPTATGRARNAKWRAANKARAEAEAERTRQPRAMWSRKDAPPDAELVNKVARGEAPIRDLNLAERVLLWQTLGLNAKEFGRRFGVNGRRVAEIRDVAEGRAAA